MAPDAPAPAPDAPEPAPADPITMLLDGMAESLDHAASMMGRALDGSYDVSDAINDLTECSARAGKLGLAAFAGVAGLVSGMRKAAPNPTHVTRDVELNPTLRHRPLTLSSSGLRAIGRGSSISIQPGDISFSPKQVMAGEQVTVTVSFANVSADERDCTLVYEGDLVAAEIAGTVAGTIRVPKPAH